MKLFEEYNKQELDAFISHEDEAYFLPLPPELMTIFADSADCCSNCANSCCTCGEMSFCYGCGCCMSCCTGDYEMWESALHIFH